jgi:hypothetical protein
VVSGKSKINASCPPRCEEGETYHTRISGLER